MQISFAPPHMMPDIRALWMESFGESPQYMDFLMEHLLRPENILVTLGEDGRPGAMLCLQEMEIACCDGTRYPGAYIYGVATAAAMRGKGLSTGLLGRTHRLLAERGICCSVLVPASETLVQFYGQRGYSPFSSLSRVQVAGDDLPRISGRGVLIPRGLEYMSQLRDSSFSHSAMYVRWPGEYLHVITAEAGLTGGEVLRYSQDGYQGFAVCYRQEDGRHILVKELAAPQPVWDQLLSSLHTRYGAQTYTLCLRPDIHTKFTNTTLPFAMIRWYDKKIMTHATGLEGAPAYIAHVLD